MVNWKARSVHWFECKGNPTVFHTDHVFVLFTMTKKGWFKACEEEHMTDVRWPNFCFGPTVWHCVRTVAGLATGRSMLIYIHSGKKKQCCQTYIWKWEFRESCSTKTQWKSCCLFSVTIFNTYLGHAVGLFPTQEEAVRPVATCPRMHFPNIQTLASLVFPQEW